MKRRRRPDATTVLDPKGAGARRASAPELLRVRRDHLRPRVPLTRRGFPATLRLDMTDRLRIHISLIRASGAAAPAADVVPREWSVD